MIQHIIHIKLSTQQYMQIYLYLLNNTNTNNIYTYICIYLSVYYLHILTYTYITLQFTYTVAVTSLITGVTPVECSCSRHWVLQLEIHQGGHVVHTQAQDLLRTRCIGAFQVKPMAISIWNDRLLHRVKADLWISAKNNHNCTERRFEHV